MYLGAMSYLVHTRVSRRNRSLQPVPIGNLLFLQRSLVNIVFSLPGINFKSKSGLERSINYALFRFVDFC